MAAPVPRQPAGAGEWRARIDHRLSGGARECWDLCDPVGELVADRGSEVAPVIGAAEAAARAGGHVVGFVTYEAAAGLDACLSVNAGRPGFPTPALPLAWFGVFAGRQPAPPPAFSAGTVGDGCWEPEIGVAEHAAAVADIREAIAAGDVYLVNLTTRLRSRWHDGDPFELYRRLAGAHRGGVHAYIETEAWAVACGSPELFLELDGNRVVTRPMKGTAPRGRWPAEDLARAVALQRSPKERAENVMVVDLLRNDLGRIAVPGGVRVPRLWQVERYPAVWQLTSTVEAQTRGEVSLVEVMRAVFPSGSVTGAPKVAAMRTIASLERSPRGVYCGAIGYLGPGQSGGLHARLAVAIRTAVVDKRRGVAEYGTGGGITFDSEHQSEWAELLMKAEAVRGPSGAGGPALVAPGTGPGTTPAGGAGGLGLIETMRFEPGAGVRNLSRHLDRLASSAWQLGFPPPSGAASAIAETVEGLVGASRVRLVWWMSGKLEVAAAPLRPAGGQPLRLVVDREPVSSDDLGLFHKTTDRRRYEQRAGRHAAADDVVLVNERGEATETTRANLLYRLGERWYTPPLESGLLPGVERGRLLDAGQVRERPVDIDGLRLADAVETVSSLRGRTPAVLVSDR